MRTLITGGAGFIGSHLCERFLLEGHSVLCLDNLLTGQKENISHLIGRPNFEFIEADVTQPLEIPGPVDFVLHFASPASPADYLKYPIETLKAGAMGTYNALELATAKGARFMLASTSEVYGDPLVHPQSESYWGHVNPIGPRSVYDEAKRFAEAMVQAYRFHRGTDTRIVRIFNTYGPRMRPGDGRVVPTFIIQALKGEPLTIYGDGTQTRSFCYIDDLVEGIVRLLYSDYRDPVNLGNPEEYTIADLAEAVQRALGRRVGVRYLPLPENDPKVRRPDISLARRILGWEPKVTLEEGLQRTVEYFRSKIGVAP